MTKKVVHEWHGEVDGYAIANLRLVVEELSSSKRLLCAAEIRHSDALGDPSWREVKDYESALKSLGIELFQNMTEEINAEEK